MALRAAVDPLTDDEISVLRAVFCYDSYREAGRHLGRTAVAVDRVIARIRLRLHLAGHRVNSKRELFAWASGCGYLPA